MYIILCVNNLSQFTFGLFGAQVNFFLEYFCIKEQYKWISEYICIRKTTRTNAYPNVFVSTNYMNMIQTNFRIWKYSNIYIYIPISKYSSNPDKSHHAKSFFISNVLYQMLCIKLLYSETSWEMRDWVIKTWALYRKLAVIHGNIWIKILN